jgi:hypothetical protein
LSVDVQPVGVEVNVGQGFNFSVVASALTTLTCQWRGKQGTKAGDTFGAFALPKRK